jgi:pimeloyl-ACP methyl ester carboxylesterase
VSTGQPRTPLIVLIHGYLDDASVWDEVIEGLTAEGIPAIAPVIARDTGDLTLATFADVIADATTSVLATVEADGVVLVGHSMGAQVAELAGRSLGDVVRGLVLLTPVPLGGLALPDEVAGPLRGCAGNAAIQRDLRSGLSASLPDDAIDRLVQIGVVVPQARVEGWFDAWTAGDPLAAAQAPPQVPALLIAGAEDRFVDKNVLSLVAARFSDSAKLTIPDVGHWPHVEAPHAVAAHVASFAHAVADGAVTSTPPTGAAEGWTGAFAAQQRDAFAATLAPHVSLHASALRRPVTGRDDVAYVMAEASQLYAQLEFVHEAGAGRLTFVEWRASTRSGVSLEGVTLLERDDADLISRIAIHHRPLDGVLAFSAELRTRTVDRLGDGYLWTGTPSA